jgi:translation initiation factor IF-3
VIGPDGDQVGIMKTAEALRFAQERDLDLVEVAPDSKPPVCRVLDYSKYKYEQAQRQKAARKHQTSINIREIKFRPKIAQHDYETKKGHVRRFLEARDKVKVTIMFRGREVAHPELGERILNRLAEELAELGQIEQRPSQDGRNMTMILGPVREGATPVAPKPKAKPTAEEAAAEARRLAGPVRLRDHDERPEEEAKESTREVVTKPAPEAAPAAAAAADGKVESAQPAGRAEKLRALREARAKERAAAEAAAKPKPAAKKPAAKKKAAAKRKAAAK